MFWLGEGEAGVADAGHEGGQEEAEGGPEKDAGGEGGGQGDHEAGEDHKSYQGVKMVAAIV